MQNLLPNLLTHLLLVEAAPGPENRSDVTRQVDILGYAVNDDDTVTPITLLGAPPFASGTYYAVLNTEDKSYTSLNGVRYADYKSWRASWAADTAKSNAEPVKATEPARGTDPTRKAPQAWFEPERIGRQ